MKNLQLSLNVLQDALIKLTLVFNKNKMKFMFSRAEDSELNNIKITAENGSVMRRVTEYKYLGVCLDDTFSFKYHISNLMVKLHQIIGFLYRYRASFPLFCRQSIVVAVFLSVLDYGDIICEHSPISNLEYLESV